MIITPNLQFNGACKNALMLYEKAFKNNVTMLMHYSDADDSDLKRELSEREKEYIYHAELYIGEQRFFFSDSLDEIPFGRNLSITITFDNMHELKEVYSSLVDGGNAIVPLTETAYSSCTATIVDRYGVRWGLLLEDK
jgi:PhnB protein